MLSQAPRCVCSRAWVGNASLVVAAGRRRVPAPFRTIALGLCCAPSWFPFSAFPFSAGSRCEGARPDGLVTGHAYSLITAKESCGFKLVQLRNPWGDSKEWNGGWSDKSEKWKEHPDVKAELEFSEAADGLFWMEWGDFASIYDTVEVRL
jgi:hypothetical protein